jgi:hypothetical protein
MAHFAFCVFYATFEYQAGSRSRHDGLFPGLPLSGINSFSDDKTKLISTRKKLNVQ